MDDDQVRYGHDAPRMNASIPFQAWDPVDPGEPPNCLERFSIQRNDGNGVVAAFQVGHFPPAIEEPGHQWPVTSVDGIGYFNRNRYIYYLVRMNVTHDTWQSDKNNFICYKIKNDNLPMNEWAMYTKRYTIPRFEGGKDLKCIQLLVLLNHFQLTEINRSYLFNLGRLSGVSATH